MNTCARSTPDDDDDDDDDVGGGGGGYVGDARFGSKRHFPLSLPGTNAREDVRAFARTALSNREPTIWMARTTMDYYFIRERQRV